GCELFYRYTPCLTLLCIVIVDGNITPGGIPEGQMVQRHSSCTALQDAAFDLELGGICTRHDPAIEPQLGNTDNDGESQKRRHKTVQALAGRSQCGYFVQGSHTSYAEQAGKERRHRNKQLQHSRHEVAIVVQD